MKEMEVVCGVLQRGERVFIAKRKSAHANGVWEFPGGKVEEKESREDAVVRELAEELHVQANVDRYLTTITDEQEGVFLRVHAYLCHSEELPHALCAHSEGRWVNGEELNDYAFQPADAAIIRQVQEVLSCLKKQARSK